jgi:hypothetical protein
MVRRSGLCAIHKHYCMYELLSARGKMCRSEDRHRVHDSALEADAFFDCHEENPLPHQLSDDLDHLAQASAQRDSSLTTRRSPCCNVQ